MRIRNFEYIMVPFTKLYNDIVKYLREEEKLNPMQIGDTINQLVFHVMDNYMDYYINLGHAVGSNEPVTYAKVNRSLIRYHVYEKRGMRNNKDRCFDYMPSWFTWRHRADLINIPNCFA